jgi:hypothetical protein
VARDKWRNCPICKGNVVTETIAFNNCEWELEGKKSDGTDVAKRGETGDNYELFDGNKKTDWAFLEIRVSPKMKLTEVKNDIHKQTVESSTNFKYDLFLSHKQANGADLAQR